MCRSFSSSLTELCLERVNVDPECFKDISLPNLYTLTLDDCGRGSPITASFLARSSPSLKHLHLCNRREGTFTREHGILALLDLPPAQLLSLHVASCTHSPDLGEVVKQMLQMGMFEKLRSMRFADFSLSVNVGHISGVVMPELRILQLPTVPEIEADNFSSLMAPSLQSLTFLYHGDGTNIFNKLEEVKEVLTHNADVPDGIKVRIHRQRHRFDRFDRLTDLNAG